MGVDSPNPSKAKEGRKIEGEKREKKKKNASPYILDMFQMLIMYM